MKYRIVEEHGVFYPEIKGWLCWKRIKKDINHFGVSTFTPENGKGTFDLDEAKELLCDYSPPAATL